MILVLDEYGLGCLGCGLRNGRGRRREEGQGRIREEEEEDVFLRHAAVALCPSLTTRDGRLLRGAARPAAPAAASTEAFGRMFNARPSRARLGEISSTNVGT